MHFDGTATSWARRTALLFALFLPGCSTLGTQLIGNGRAAYNEIIRRTDDEQLLGLIVRTRYGESSGLLAVTSVTANVRVRGSIGGELGIGPDASFAGNLVPLSAGAVYEENPTISYAPLQGERFTRQLLSPLPVEILALFARALRGSELTLGLFAEQINTLRNPLYDVPVEQRAGFERVARQIAGLERDGIAEWWVDPEPPHDAKLVLSCDAPEPCARVRELMEALGLAAPADPVGPRVALPVRLGVPSGEPLRLDIQTRSLFDVITIAAARVEVPEPDLREGRADPRYERVSAPADFLRIHSSEKRPENATVAVRHRGAWFYIDDADASSKFAFRILGSLLAMRLAEAAPATAPMLTIPASR